MAASLAGRMFELSMENCTNDYNSEPMIITNNIQNESDNKKITIDLNINLHVHHHYSPESNDKEFKLIEF